MPIGDNIPRDKVIRKTGKASTASNTSIIRKGGLGQPSADPEADTYQTEKMTFYIKRNLYRKLKNFAYWDRHSLTEAFNLALTDGLKGKNTKDRG